MAALDCAVELFVLSLGPCGIRTVNGRRGNVISKVSSKMERSDIETGGNFPSKHLFVPCQQQKNTRKNCEISLELTIKTLERRH